jgi:hypothetical protein
VLLQRLRDGAASYQIRRDVPWAGDAAGAFTPSYGHVGEYEDEVTNMEKEIGVQGAQMTPLGLFVRTSIPFIWRILSAFLPA